MHRRFFAVLVVLAALYSAYWLAGRMAVTRGLTVAESHLGAGFSYASRGTTGYPSRFDTTWQQPRYQAGGLTLSAPMAQLFALSYRPDGAIAFTPGPLELSVAGHSARLDASDLRASLRVVPGRDLRLRRATMVGEDLALSINGQPIGQLPRLLLALRRADPPQGRLAVWAEAENLTPPTTPVIERIEIDASVQLSAPLGVLAPAPRIAGIDLRHARITWGTARLSLSGALTVDPRGRLEGRLQLSGTEWQSILDGATDLGLLEPQVAETWRLLGLRAGSADRLELSMPVRGGRVFLGLVPIAVLPAVQRQ